VSHGTDRYDVKAAAGLSRVRRDGSSYDRAIDAVSSDAEEWFADRVGGIVDTSVHDRHGDHGYDVVVMLPCGERVRIDVVHLGLLPDGTPRPASGARLIVNRDSIKLLRSDVIVVMTGPPFVVVGAIHTIRFLALAREQDLGFGIKFVLPVAQLPALRAVLPVTV